MTTFPHLAYNNIIDADGHILEPPDVWEKYIDPKFRDRAIRIRLDREGHEYLELDGRPSRFFNIKAFTLLGGMGRWERARVRERTAGARLDRPSPRPSPASGRGRKQAAMRA